MSEKIKNTRQDANSICVELRNQRRQGLSYKQLNEAYPLYLEEILGHVVGTCECNVEVEELDSREEDEPWCERYVLQTLRIEENMRFTQMAEVLDCHPETAKKYVDKFDVSPLDSSDRTSSPTVNELQRLGAENDGDIQIE